MIYLITGATGDIGSRVVERLLERGDRPRIFVPSDLEKARARYGDRVDIAVGSLRQAKSLSALEGVGALFLVNSGPELASRDAAAAIVAKAAGVKIWSSSRRWMPGKRSGPVYGLSADLIVR